MDGHPTTPALFTVIQDLGGSATQKCEKFGQSKQLKITLLSLGGHYHLKYILQVIGSQCKDFIAANLLWTSDL